MAIRFQQIEHIAAPPEAVTAAIAAIGDYGAWMPNFVRVERLTEGPFGVGTQFRETRKMFGRDSTEHFEVVAFEPGRRVELFVDGTKGTMGKGAFRFAYTLAPEGGGTRMTVDGELSGLSRIGELFGKLFMGPMKKAIAKDHVALKAHIEGRAGSSA